LAAEQRNAGGNRRNKCEPSRGRTHGNLLPVDGRLLDFRLPAAAQVRTPFRLFACRMLARRV
jgi:hypothetical protein